MSTEQLINTCEDAFRALLYADPIQALSLVTATFVGMVVALSEERGFNADGEIKIDGGLSRDITIHSKKVI